MRLLLVDLQRIAHFVDLADLVTDAENGLRPIHHLVVDVVVLAVLGDAVPVGAVEQRLAQCFVVGAFLEGGEILCLLSIQERFQRRSLFLRRRIVDFIEISVQIVEPIVSSESVASS